MLAKTNDLLQSAVSGNYAIGGFNIYNLEGVQAVISAAEAAESGVLLQVHPGALAHGGRPLIALCVSAAHEASVPVGVHLDHCSDLVPIVSAIEAGMTSVMADGSHLSYEENVAFVRHAVDLAHAKGISVEGELGRISGTEDSLTVESIHARMTEPDEAARFVAETGIDALAVCIGNIHGRYPFPPKLDFDRLTKIREAVSVPLVLHGASGLDDGTIEQAIALGIRKFNVNTEVRGAYLEALKTQLTQQPAIDLVPLMTAVRDAMHAVVLEKIHLFKSVGSASVSVKSKQLISKE